MNELLVESEYSELQQHEQVIEQGLKTFVDVGNALLAIRDKRLYRQDFGTFEEYCNDRWGFTDRRARMLMSAAEAVSNIQIGTIVPILPATESQARPLTKLEPELQATVWQKAVETAPNGKVTAAHVETTVRTMLPPNASRVMLQPPMVTTVIAPKPPADVVSSKTHFTLAPPINIDEYEEMAEELAEDDGGYDWTEDEPEPATVHRNGYANGNGHTTFVSPVAPNHMAIHFSSESPEHYTPKGIIEAAIAVLGAIDLDPCSNSKDTPNVPALEHFTAADDGLSMPWYGRVYMNPPYGRVISGWTEKLAAEYEAGNVTEGIALVPGRIDTQWWQSLGERYAACFYTGRLTFIGNNDPAPFPSTIFYLGENIAKFYEVFSAIGQIWTRIDEHWFTS